MTRTLTVAGVQVPVPAWLIEPREPGWSDVYPDGCMDVLWHSGRLLIAGPATDRMNVRRAPGARSAGLRFPGGALPALLGVPAHALRDEVVALEEFWPGAERWTQITAEAADPRVALAALVRDQAVAPPTRGQLLRLIERRAGAGATAAAIAAETGYSERHLRRLCLDAFGYGPRTLGRIHRFVAASSALQGGARAADVAASTGYADQPHMIREFRSLTGRTPGWFTPRPAQPAPDGPGA